MIAFNTRPYLRLLPGLICVVALAQFAGCALMSRGETLQVRYFTLEDGEPAPQRPAAKTDLALKLGRVEASGGLGEQIAVRKGTHELSYRDDQRWTERPAQYARRELERALYRERGLVRSYSGFAPLLEVELLELELIEAGDKPLARVRMAAQLRDDHSGLCQDSFQTELPIEAKSTREDMERSVAALSAALHDTVQSVAERTVQCLTSRATAKAGEDSAAIAFQRPEQDAPHEQSAEADDGEPSASSSETALRADVH